VRQENNSHNQKFGAIVCDLAMGAASVVIKLIISFIVNIVTIIIIIIIKRLFA